MLHEVTSYFPRLALIWMDLGYRGQPLREWFGEHALQQEIVQKPRRWGRYPIDVEPPPMPAFTVLPHRWIVERTFAWLGRYRRLSKDYEELPASGEAMIYAAMLGTMLRRSTRLTRATHTETLEKAYVQC